MKKLRAFTLIELLVVVAIIALLISILLPSLSRARESAKRTACSANVKDIGTACYIYQEENRGVFPTAPDAINVGSTPIISYIGYMGGHGALPRDEQSIRAKSGGSTQLSNSRSLWLLVRSGAVVPKNFICPSSDESPDPTVDVARYYDFIGFGSISYGYQVPYDDRNTCKPNVDVDPRMALMADKSPWSGVSTNEAAPGEVDFQGAPFFNEQISSFAGAIYGQLTNAMCAGPNLGRCTDESPPERWVRFNSPNHGGLNQGAGQSVLYPDGHSSWHGKPTAGVDHDNIYTKMETPSPSVEGDFLEVLEWGVLPRDDGLTYPGRDALQTDTDSFTDSLLWP